MRSKIFKGILAVAAVIVVAVVLNATRPLITAPEGTRPLDLTLDTTSVAHLVVDEADVLSEDMKTVISIYNANWRVLAGRVLAVVTVERAKNAENEAWKWVQRLSLGKNDALMLIEATGGRNCVLVSGGTFRADIETLDENYLTRLAYMSIHDGAFDAAVLAVFDRFHYFYGYDQESHLRTFRTEGTIAFCVLVALMLPIFIHFVAEKIDRWRFRRWYENYGQFDESVLPWRTVFFWHRVGSKWYEMRISGEWVDYRNVLRHHRRERGVRAIRNGRFR